MLLQPRCVHFGPCHHPSPFSLDMAERSALGSRYSVDSRRSTRIGARTKGVFLFLGIDASSNKAVCKIFLRHQENSTYCQVSNTSLVQSIFYSSIFFCAVNSHCCSSSQGTTDDLDIGSSHSQDTGINTDMSSIDDLDSSSQNKDTPQDTTAEENSATTDIIPDLGTEPDSSSNALCPIESSSNQYPFAVTSTPESQAIFSDQSQEFRTFLRNKASLYEIDPKAHTNTPLIRFIDPSWGDRFPLECRADSDPIECVEREIFGRFRQFISNTSTSNLIHSETRVFGDYMVRLYYKQDFCNTKVLSPSASNPYDGLVTITMFKEGGFYTLDSIFSKMIPVPRLSEAESPEYNAIIESLDGLSLHATCREGDIDIVFNPEEPWVVQPDDERTVLVLEENGQLVMRTTLEVTLLGPTGWKVYIDIPTTQVTLIEPFNCD